MLHTLIHHLRCPLHTTTNTLQIHNRNQEAASDVRDIANFFCSTCRRTFPIFDGIPDFVIPASDPKYERFSSIEARQWDCHANLYEEKRSEDAIYLASCDAAAEAIMPVGNGQLVLDVGCGTGMVTKRYFDEHIRLACLDLSLESLLLCRRRLGDAGSRVLFIRADATAIPFHSALFEKTICANTLQHLPAADLRQKLVAELGRVTGGGSDVVISAHNYSTSKQKQSWKKEGQAGSASGEIQYIYRFEVGEFESLLAEVFPRFTIRSAGFALPYCLKLSAISRRMERWLQNQAFAIRRGHMLIARCQR